MGDGGDVTRTKTVLGWRSWPIKKKALVVFSVLLIIAIAVGLGVGLGIGSNNSSEVESEEPAQGTVSWKPRVGTTWQIELLYPLNDTSHDVDVYDIDLFINGEKIISKLHGDGRKVICYFSAGSYENWRPDVHKFRPEDLGNTLEGWEDERWLDIRSNNVRDIMKDRLDMARDKGCDGVDPDNVDGYDNDNGLSLTQDDSISFVTLLAREAHARGLSIGLKNAGDIIDSVIDLMQWGVNEQCAEFDECDTYAVFTEQGKPVFHIEYPKGDEINDNKPVTSAQKYSACNAVGSGNFSTIIKNMNLDNWVQIC
ncbi:hypothetical protein VTN31DRAFT_3879 [Thermomyces dupontii]|uniref:uncharacterized protein n=1 Tax=Talaromyces thermophilus TaxID=28565 RepID=UPI003742DCBA